MGGKAKFFIKTLRMDLCMQMQFAHAPLPGFIHQPCQDRAADTATAPTAQHGHAADMTVGQQASGTDRTPFRIQSQRMRRYGIGIIPFEFLGNPLLDNEYITAQRLQ